MVTSLTNIKKALTKTKFDDRNGWGLGEWGTKWEGTYKGNKIRIKEGRFQTRHNGTYGTRYLIINGEYLTRYNPNEIELKQTS